MDSTQTAPNPDPATPQASPAPVVTGSADKPVPPQADIPPAVDPQQTIIEGYRTQIDALKAEVASGEKVIADLSKMHEEALTHFPTEMSLRAMVDTADFADLTRIYQAGELIRNLVNSRWTVGK